MVRFACALLSFGLTCLMGVLPLSADESKPRLILIGDSTVKNGQGRGDGGLWGWGQVIDKHFDTSRIDIENHAIGGRSSRTFLTEGRWDRALERLRKGDFVIMQFGHNDGGEMFKGDRPRASIKGNGDETRDGVVEATGKSETVHSYGWYLRKYVADAKSKGAIPIVCSLVPRDRWQDGEVIRSEKDYTKWAYEAAKQGGALFINLNDVVARRYELLGEREVGAVLFTEKDWTHTTKLGAQATAECLAEVIRQMEDCQLKDYLLPVVEPLYRNQPELQFDLRQQTGFEDPYMLRGATKVSPETKYSTELGYGFEDGSRVQLADSEAQSATGFEGCVSAGSFFFSVSLPEGNYNVSVHGSHEPLTVKGELRRLLADQVEPDSLLGLVKCEFTVNVRTPTIAGDAQVRLKPREKEDELRAWDDRLTLEFNGPRPAVSVIIVEPDPKAITVFLAGDSTVTDQPHEPWASWGQMLPAFFRWGVAVANYAESGESISSSLGAKRFEKIFSLMKPGDYLFIQFGHNDMKDKSPDALDRYRANLVKLVNETREHGGVPVLVTSMERKDGVKASTLGDYPQTVRDVATELEVALIDLNAQSLMLYQALGKSLDKAFQDGTHHTNYGAYLLAKCVVQSIRDLKLPLAERIRVEFTGFDPQHPDTFESVDIPPSPITNLTQPAGN